MEEDRVRLRFNRPWPTWRVIRRPFAELEKECRARDFYDLAHVTEGADGQYTLFFRLKPEHQRAAGEHVPLMEAPDAA